jgi:isoleucyl-tRNA synthetase
MTDAPQDFEVPRPPQAAYVALVAESDLGARWSFLQGKAVCFAAWVGDLSAMASAVSLRVDPELEYVFYALGERVLVLAKVLLPRVLSEVAPSELTLRKVSLAAQAIEAAVLAHPERILGYALGEELEHLRYRHPLLERGDEVTCSARSSLANGTGLLLVAGEGVDSGRGAEGVTLARLAASGALLTSPTVAPAAQ